MSVDGVCTAVWESDSSRNCLAREVEPGQNLCIAHHPRMAELIADAAASHLHRVELIDTEITVRVVDALRSALSRRGAPGEDVGFDLDCSGSTFAYATKFDRHRFEGAVRFESTVFQQPVDFSEAVFANRAEFPKCSFVSTANFRASRFEDAAVFCSSTFRRAEFSEARFAPLADFSDALFERQPAFRGAMFSGVWFAHARFPTGASFDGASFDGSASFDGADQSGAWSFTYAELGVETRLGYRSGPVPLQLDRVIWSAPALLEVGHTAVALRNVVLREPLTITSQQPGQPLDDVDAPPGRLDAVTGCTLLGPLTVAPGVALTDTSFVGTTGLEQLRIPGDPAWRIRNHRRVIHDDHANVSPPVVEHLYRQLRAGLELSKAAPAAADFYYGELEMRRRAAERWNVDRSLLWLYKWLGGYGVRAWRPFTAYALLVTLAALLLFFRTDTFVTPELRAAGAGAVEGGGGLAFDNWWDVVAFVARSSISVFSATTDGLTAWGTVLLIVVRLLAVAFIALGVFALRSRVHR